MASYKKCWKLHIVFCIMLLDSVVVNEKIEHDTTVTSTATGKTTQNNLVKNVTKSIGITLAENNTTPMVMKTSGQTSEKTPTVTETVGFVTEVFENADTTTEVKVKETISVPQSSDDSTRSTTYFGKITQPLPSALPDVTGIMVPERTTATLIYLNPNLDIMDKYIKTNKTVQNYLAGFENDVQRRVVETQLKLCPYVQTCGFPLNIITSRLSCCEECSCDSSCSINRTCCPNILDKGYFEYQNTNTNGTLNSSTGLSMPGNTPQCISKHLTLRTSYLQNGFYSISGCPIDVDIELRDKCMRPYSADTRFKDFLPVFSNTSLEIYRNQYCAICNGMNQTDLVFFKPSFSCPSGQIWMNDVTSERDVTQLVFASEDCDVTFNSGDTRIDIKDCDYSISMCNVTGLWQKYDPETEQACLAYRSLFHHEEYVFQNVFCALCNGMHPHTVTCEYIHPLDALVFSFSGLMRLDTEQAFDDTKVVGDDATQCTRNQIYDSLMEECKDLFCPPMRTLHGGTCVNLFEFIGGDIAYNIYFRLIPLNELTLIDVFEVELSIYNSFFGLLTPLKSFSWAMCHVYMTYTSVERYQVAGESKLKDSKLSYADGKLILVDNGFQKVPWLNVDQISHLDGTVITVANNLSFLFILKESDDRLFQIIDTLSELRDISDALFRTTSISESFSIMSKYSLPSAAGLTTIPSAVFQFTRPFCGEVGIVIDIQRFSSCPKVNMSKHSYFWTDTIDGLVLGDVKIKGSEFYHVDQNHVMLCADSFQKVVVSLIPGRELSAEVIASVVSSGLSVAALFISVVVYCMLPDLRKTLPGKNTTALMISMFVAQILLLVGSLNPFQQYSVGCKVVGLLIHFSWLCCIFWMNVCTYHMFRVLTVTKLVSHDSNHGKFASFIIYVIIMAAVCVAANVVISTSVSDQFGYGGKFCYITSQKRILYTFALPAIFVVCINLSMFVFVIIRIKSSPDIRKSAQNERNELLILTKLSTITGITWVFGFLYMWTDILVFSYIFILLNASQGVFLLFAFVVNRRVLSLWKKLYNDKSKLALSKTNSGNPTTNTQIKP